MATATTAQTYVLILNSSDLERLSQLEFDRPLYIHTYTDLILFALLITASLMTNALLTTTLATNRYLQQISSHVPILVFSLNQLVDVIFNGLISLAYIIRMVWDMGYPLCSIQNFSTHLTLGLSPLILATIAIDRYVCVNYPNVYRVQFTCFKLRLISAVLVLISAVFSVPYLTSLLTSRPFPARMSCAGGYTHQIAFIICWLFFIICLPFIVVILASINLIRALYLDNGEKERLRSRAWLEAKGIALSSGVRPPLAQNEVKSVMMCLTLCVVYLLCTLPYVIHAVIHQLNSSIVLEEKQHSEVCVSPLTDVALTWFRYLATILYPVVVYFFCHDVRHETMALISMWRVRPSLVLNEATTTVDDLVNASSKSRWWKFFKRKKSLAQKESSSGTAQETSVVLFQSEVGLQMRYSKGRSASYHYIWCDQFDVCCYEKRQRFIENNSPSLNRHQSPSPAANDNYNKRVKLNEAEELKKEREREVKRQILKSTNDAIANSEHKVTQSTNRRKRKITRSSLTDERVVVEGNSEQQVARGGDNRSRRETRSFSRDNRKLPETSYPSYSRSRRQTRSTSILNRKPAYRRTVNKYIRKSKSLEQVPRIVKKNIANNPRRVKKQKMY